MPIAGKQWDYIEDLIAHVAPTEGLQTKDISIEKEIKETEKLNRELSAIKIHEITDSEPDGLAQWIPTFKRF